MKVKMAYEDLLESYDMYMLDCAEVGKTPMKFSDFVDLVFSNII